ncbi:GGDEF domain-containing protein [Pelagibacterium xiamenense]|uniref:GGDEF domain-containing protein n=1 Tax=Pelagibacterium xiamenense TaxID=2901140 RepID=UPI001E28A226|nr:GGDEF domain-containing protein [Pelagibacterium xiamenense]MCD7058353.1 GGDEF domain-containing protein [Pelagibacterium xiamenense]
MSGALFVFSINVTLALAMAAGFFAVARFDPKNTAARWMVLAFLLGGLSIASEFAISGGIFVSLARMTVALAFLAAMLTVAVALSRYYNTTQDWPSLSVIFVASAMLYTLTLEMPRNDPVRQVLYQLPYALVSLLGLSHVWRSKRRAALDWCLMVLLMASALLFAAKSVIANLVGGVGAQAQDYSRTVYAMISQSSGAILVLMVGMLILVMLARETAARLIRQSERDSATGFLNRTGFMNHGDALLRKLGNGSASEAALILLALDGSFEDAAVETQIRLLAGLLHAIDPPGACIGRLGPTQFAVLLPHVNLLSARQTAEGLRRKTAKGEKNAPAATASFGITERERTDTLSDMILRADWALEEARHAGGDCVRLSARAALGVVRHGAVS